MVKLGPTNPVTIALARELRKTKAPFWKRAAELLEKRTRAHVEVNLAEIARFAKEGETIVVPGKILGTGSLPCKLTLSCYKISASAAGKVKKSGGKVLGLAELAKADPKGKELRLFI